jgi:hydrogenase expression/formation protein HypC
MLLDEEVTFGDYVIIHAGFAIRKLDLKEAQESLTILRDLANAYEEVQRKYDQEALDRAKA